MHCPASSSQRATLLRYRLSFIYAMHAGISSAGRMELRASRRQAMRQLPRGPTPAQPKLRPRLVRSSGLRSSGPSQQPLTRFRAPDSLLWACQSDSSGPPSRCRNSSESQQQPRQTRVLGRAADTGTGTASQFQLKLLAAAAGGQSRRAAAHPTQPGCPPRRGSSWPKPPARGGPDS